VAMKVQSIMNMRNYGEKIVLSFFITEA